MKYNRNQNSYEELQTIVEAQQEKIETLLTRLHKFRVLALDEELFAEAMKEASEGGEEKTEFTLDRNEIYSLEGTTKEQREKLYQWLLKNDIGWEEQGYFQRDNVGIIYEGKEWTLYWSGYPTKYIKDLI